MNGLAAESDALVRALRSAQSRALTERARGRADEERDWLDMCALLEPTATQCCGATNQPCARPTGAVVDHGTGCETCGHPKSCHAFTWSRP